MEMAGPEGQEVPQANLEAQAEETEVAVRKAELAVAACTVPSPPRREGSDPLASCHCCYRRSP